MKKLNKFFAVLVALAMMATLCVSMAFAQNPAVSTEAGKDAKAKATKVLNKAEGVSDPTVKTYTFNIADKNTGEGTLGSKTATVTAPDNLSVADILDAYTFTKTGKYEFTVTEAKPVVSEGGWTFVDEYAAKRVVEDEKYKTTETMDYSQASYTVTALVASDTDADGHTTYYVQSVAVTQQKDDDGNLVNDTKPEEDSGAADTAEFKFTNKYNKQVENLKNTDPENPSGEDDDDALLVIEKKVENKKQDETTAANPDQEFKFRATIQFPANTKSTTYTAVVKNAEGPTDQTVTFTKGAGNSATAVFTLKANEWLSFDKIDIGAQLTELTEDSYPGFETTDEIKDEADPVIVKDTQDNKKTVTNKWDSSTGSLTGILMSNIPYIVLALVAIGGLCAYVVVRRKNADEA